MSDSYREQCIKAKDARRGVVEQRAPKPKKRGKVAKPWVVQYLSPFHFLRNGDWSAYARYRTREDAQMNLAKFQRKLPRWQWRIVGPDV